MATMKTPENGIRVRMYRIGHGDCFLIAMPRKDSDVPYYILIDCGYKPGSQNFLPHKDVKKVINHIATATNKTIDLVVVTHEHQDHVNAFWKKRSPFFKDFDIKEAWFAWTESPTDRLAKKIRKKHKDQLLGLVEGRRLLGLSLEADNPTLKTIDNLLSMEFGGDKEEAFNHKALSAAAKDPSKSRNKQSMKLVKDKAQKNKGIRYLNPGDFVELKETDGFGAYVLGPPRREKLLLDEDPIGDEAFPSQNGHHLSFNAAVLSGDNKICPFRREYRVEKNSAFGHGFFKKWYGIDKHEDEDGDKVEVPSNASWRRIDDEWLYSTENLALKINRGVNNTSLVLGFELPKSKKVLLFAADAQRGNWISWDDNEWKRGDDTITAKDILGRTVLYKVGHHASHNATLKGNLNDSYPNLGWMAQGKYAQEFTAMITAVNEWAMTKNSPPWRHPLPSIKSALLEKAQGRVFQTDEDEVKKTDNANISDAEWQKFLDRTDFNDLYFDLDIIDE
ncbi:hypothetical protein [Flagellimonas algicola]|uniref:Metallo-beta-lactamase superfamily protein n=1 Tax=Flagellimonas algicola TaxID=2583815 RepID=A0ABY2WSJ2_9FLAO|nr:hypothetical protein [Allomuricauda algicola]TMU57489.1 hypothetical protein FGG15_08075 [Allomuricauda algicola]